MLIILVVAVVSIAALAMSKKHYLLGVSIVLFGLYELFGPLLYYFDDFGEFAQSMAVYNLVATPDLVSLHVELIGTFLIFFLASYVISPVLIERIFSWRFSQSFLGYGETNHAVKFKHYYILLTALAIFGLVSVAQDVGTQRLHDYLGYEYSVTPFYSYGTLLMVCVAPLVIYSIRMRHWGRLALVVLCALPIASQIFISSRRQFFAPMILFFTFYLLYQKGGSRRFLWLALFLTGSLMFLGMQAQMRIWITGVDYTNTDATVPVAVQVAEFVAISSTTLYALVYVDPAFFTDFLHFFVLGVCNAIPYVKFGEILFPDYTQGIQRMFETIAPFGGLSVIAESYAAAGYTGVAIVACIAGAIFYFGNLAWRAYSTASAMPSLRLVFYCCCICTIILKYRSGFTDAFLASVNFALLYFACTLPFFLEQQRGRAASIPLAQAKL